jgi:LytS/YehU family sensor histidine kinase
MDFAELGVYNIVMVAVIYLVAVESSGLRKAEAITMARGYQEAKLHNLQANLSPHFLFNTLNVIRALVYADPAKADQAITSLASLLRRSLRTSGVSLINLGEELERIEVLLRLARLRYHDRLQTHIHVPDQLLETLVPPMLLFNLVENAITHGIGSLELGGMITISARATRDQVHISIRNSGTLDGNATRGNGTQDALQRLEMLFGGKAKFSLSQMDEKTVSADVDLPLSPTYQL